MLPLFNARTIKNWSENVDPTNVQFENATKWLNLLRNNKLEDEKSNYIKFQTLSKHPSFVIMVLNAIKHINTSF